MEAVMSQRRFKAVVFELDDVLYPKRQYIVSGCKVVAQYLQRLYGIDLYQKMLDAYDQGEADFMGAALKSAFRTVEPQLIQRVQEVFRCHFPSLDLYPEARVALALLGTAGFQKALVTDGYGCVQRCKVDSLGLRPLIDSVVFSDDLGGPEYWRPAPDPFFIMGLQLDVDVSEMIFVGADPDKDFIAPKQLGMGTICIVRDNMKTIQVSEKGPLAVIPSLDRIMQAVESLENLVIPRATGLASDVRGTAD